MNKVADRFELFEIVVTIPQETSHQKVKIISRILDLPLGNLAHLRNGVS